MLELTSKLTFADLEFILAEEKEEKAEIATAESERAGRIQARRRCASPTGPCIPDRSSWTFHKDGSYDVPGAGTFFPQGYGVGCGRNGYSGDFT